MSDTNISKVCTKCKAQKPLNEFYKRYSECKQCFGERMRTYEQTPRGKLARRTARSNHRKTTKCKETTANYVLRDYVKKMRYDCKMRNSHAHPERARAMDRIQYLIRKGKIAKAQECDCEYCGKQARIYHHPKGYLGQNALNVIPVCYKCHYAIHVTQVPSPRTL